MYITWKLPGEQPDPAIIARMRSHFLMPPELMPVAWFMGKDLEYYPSLRDESPKTINANILCRALADIAGGINYFPKVRYVPVWKRWFRYLLPDLILRATDPANFNTWDVQIIVQTIIAFFQIYPGHIDESYPGFGDDVVSALGTCAIPPILARDSESQTGEHNRLFIDIWDENHQFRYYGFRPLAEVNVSILFCLKYLSAEETSQWAASLFHIDSPQWHLQMIFSMTAWHKMLKMVQEWNHEEAFALTVVLKLSEILDPNPPITQFTSFEEFVPTENVEAFEQIISEYFSLAVFQSWKKELQFWLSTSKYNLEHERYLDFHLTKVLEDCETEFFNSARE